MKKTLILALLAVALIAMPADASVQNVKISGDIDSTWVVRDQFDLGNVDEDNRFYQNFLITQTRVRIDADLTDNVSATVALINERVWGEDAEDSTNGDNDIDLNLAFVTLREMLYSPLTVIIGRQNFAYGNSFAIDSAGTNNNIATGGLNSVAEDFTKRTALDAVRMVFDYNPLTIDIVASKVEGNNSLGTGKHDDDIDLFGTNVNYQLGDDMESVVEGYFWARIDQDFKTPTGAGGSGAGATAPNKADTVFMPGIRASTNLSKGLNVQAELAGQFGNKAIVGNSISGENNVPRRALGGQIITNYMLPFEETADWSPVVTGVYTYTSGDSGPSAGKNPGAADREYYTAWDPMFENQGGGTIYNTLFNLTNSHIYTLRAQVNPIEDVTASVEWNGIWLDKELNDHPELGGSSSGTDKGTCSGADCITLLQPDGSTLTNVFMTDNKKLGDEVGLAVVYDYTEDVQFGARADWFIPGAAFDGHNNQVASQYVVNGNVNF